MDRTLLCLVEMWAEELWGCPVVSGTRVLVLSPLGCEECIDDCISFLELYHKWNYKCIMCSVRGSIRNVHKFCLK